MKIRRRNRVVAPVALAILIIGAANGCTAADPPPPFPSTQSGPQPQTQTPTQAPSEPPPVSLHPEGTSSENLPFFTAIVKHVWASNKAEDGDAYVDALATAGFPRSDMQRTSDVSTVGNPAESMMISVRWIDGQCLLAQVGPSTGEPVTAVLPVLADGSCLVGHTAAIG